MCENATLPGRRRPRLRRRRTTRAGSPAARARRHRVDATREVRDGAEMIRYTLDLNDDDGSRRERRRRRRRRGRAAPEVPGRLHARAPGVRRGQRRRVRQRRRAGSASRSCSNPATAWRRFHRVTSPAAMTPWDWSHGAVPACGSRHLAHRDHGHGLERQVRHARLVPAHAHPDGRPLAAQHAGFRRVGVDRGRLRAHRRGLHDRVKDANERGLSGALVRLGSGRATYTNSSGYYSFRVPTGSYARCAMWRRPASARSRTRQLHH